jgi:hypothetical protein
MDMLKQVPQLDSYARVKEGSKHQDEDGPREDLDDPADPLD